MRTLRLLTCALALAGGTLLLSQGEALAQIGEDNGEEILSEELEQELERCLALMQDGETLRGCTLTERFGQCLTWAVDALDTCRESGGFLWGLACWYSSLFDVGECVSNMIADLLPICTSGSSVD